MEVRLGMKINLKDCADALGVSKHYLRTEAAAGRIPHFKSGNKYYFDLEQVDAYLNDLSMEQVRISEKSEKKVISI